MNLSSLSPRLRVAGEAFALSAFVLPLLCLASGAFYFTWGHSPQNAQWNIALATGATMAIFCCGLGGLLFALLGQVRKQKRLLRQGLFGMGISIALAVTVWAVALYIGVLI